MRRRTKCWITGMPAKKKPQNIAIPKAKIKASSSSTFLPKNKFPNTNNKKVKEQLIILIITVFLQDYLIPWLGLVMLFISSKNSPSISPKFPPKSPKISAKISPPSSPPSSPKISAKISPKISPPSSPKISPPISLYNHCSLELFNISGCIFSIKNSVCCCSFNRLASQPNQRLVSSSE